MSDFAVQELASMAEVLRYRAAAAPEDRAFLYLLSDGTEGPELTYAQLDERARAIAARLGQLAEPGDRAVLLYAPGLEFVPAFFGCLYAGVIAVPAWPPRPDRPWQGAAALSRLVEDCGPRVLLTGGDEASLFRDLCRDLPPLADVVWIDTTNLPFAARGWSNAAEDRGGVSHLQYTSGSTGTPKGVMITHENVMRNQQAIAELCGHFATAAAGVCGMNWLPFQHDFALIGALLQSIYVGGPLVVTSPLTMLQRPYLWLEAISRFRVYSSSGPGFAYDLCVRRISAEQHDTLDLSCWKLAFIGAEPIRPTTLDDFCDAFGPAGFDRAAFCPGYGLAEATLFVTSTSPNAAPTIASFPISGLDNSTGAPTTRKFVGCGKTFPGQDLRIVDPATGRPCPEGQTGEIWFAGASVARGYWNHPEETRETFHATLADSPGVHFLRTGDLGRLQEGELFVVGRIKDLIIVRGQNHHPQDIEESVRASDPACEGATIAFQLEEDAGSRLTVLQEIRPRQRGFDPVASARRIRAAIIERHGIQLDEILFVKQATLPKTASGKPQRFACRDLYQQNRLVRWIPKNPTHQPEA